MTTRFVLYDEELGVFIGHALGMCFWSKLDAVGHTDAATFDSAEDMERFVAEWIPNTVKMWRAVEVEVNEDGYAPMAACVVAGLPAWSAE